MEAILRKSDDEFIVKEEKRVESVKGDKEGFKEEFVFKVGNGRRDHEDHKLKQSSPNQKVSSYGEQDNQLESAKAEMGEVREENQRLKMYLNQIMKDYKALQVQFYDIIRQEAESSITADRYEETKESQLVSLSLGRTSSDPKKDTEIPRKCKEDQQDREGLDLGLDCMFEVNKTLKPSPENSSNEVKDEAGKSWRPAHKVLKTMRSGDDEVSQQNPVKKARVSVRFRCDTPTMNDGCQWRKYGQKIAKGNPCPRAYYRCTVTPSCPVRKQVQRCAEDMSILITTYEGTHNHSLPLSATAMASTTSAAASMLMSGSSSSGAGPNTPSAGIATSIANLRGLNFYHSDNLKSNQFYLPNSSLSSSPSNPTITLDLTSNSSSSSSHFNQMSSNFLSTPRYSSTNLNFSSLESNPLPMPWTQPYKKNEVGSLKFGRRPQENFYQSFMQKSNPTPISFQQPLPADSIAAATKAITSDPSFQSALAAALTSIIGTSSGGSGGGGGGTTLGYQGGDKFGQNLKLGEPFSVVSNFPSTTPSANKCSSSYLNRDHIV